MRLDEPKSSINRIVTPITIRFQRIKDLKLNSENPRIHSRRQIDQIAGSIKAFGFMVPVLIDATMRILAGHGRILAARQIGLEEVPTIQVDHLTEAHARAFILADNKLTENAAWDERLLAEQLHDLSLMELDFSLEVTGFEVGEIDLLVQGLESNGDGDDADKLPVVRRSAVSRAGDVWLLGSHRIYCGNALDEASYTKLMAAEKASMVFSDPPYNVAIDGNVSGFGANRHRDFAMAFGEMGAAEYIAFLARAVELNARHSKPAAIHFYSSRKGRSPMSLDKKTNYQVGYAKPPRKTRFEKGKSGNPAGRMKGSKNVFKLLLEAVEERIELRRLIAKAQGDPN
jgi:Family of unknown function (DUF5681)/ParB-like nuclease domain